MVREQHYRPRVHKAFQVQDQDQAQVSKWIISGLFSLSVRENLICVYIDMVNVVLDLKCIRLKYMLETINYIKVDPVI